MIKFYITLLFSFWINFSYATDVDDITEIKVIELHNRSIDQIIETNSNIANSQIVVGLDNDLEDETNEEGLISNDEVNNTDSNDINLTLNTSPIDVVSELPGLWESIQKENLIYLLDNIKNIKSHKLRQELLLSLNTKVAIPKDFKKNNFEKLIIDMILKLGDRKKVYELINTLSIDGKNIHNNFYNKFTINYLLSTYNLSEACEFRDLIKNLSVTKFRNFYLKIDIFCLALQEKFDEANLLNSLLIESSTKDKYFQYLFEKLQDTKLDINFKNLIINEENIFLYSAMHRIGDLPLTDKFLKIDPINLSMPIILSSSTNIELRIKAAHYAYFNNIISNDSVAALYQTVDFTYQQLNTPSEFIASIDNNIELGMAYFYQLINVQLLPLTRIESIIKFWEFSEKNNLESVAYSLSLKNLNTLEPSEELAFAGPQIAKAYISNKDFEMAKKWIKFSQNYLSNEVLINKLNSINLLFKLSESKEEENLIDILYEHTIQIKKQDVNFSNLQQNEYLYLIFASFDEEKLKNLSLNKKIVDKRQMPSLYILNLIRNSIIEDDEIQLLLSVLVSIEDKNWNELHPEHFNLIISALKKYQSGLIFNEVLLEILKNNEII